MTSLTTYYEERDLRKLKYTVRIAGFTVTGLRGLSYSYARGRVPVASITIPNPPALSITAWNLGRRAPVEVYLGFGIYDVRVFTGTVESVSRNERFCTIDCAGTSKALDSVFARTINVPFVGSATSIVENLLDEAGIDDHDVNLPAWTVGSVVPQTKQFQSYGDAINSVSEVDGSIWHEMPTGQIKVGVFDPMPAPAPFRTYYAAIPSGVTESKPAGVTNVNARPRLRGIDIKEYPREVKNRVWVRGATVGENVLETHAKSDSPWVPNPPRYSDHTFPNELLDEASKVASSAVRQITLRNRLETVVTARISGDPQVFLCGTVRIEDPRYSGVSGRWFIEAYTTSLTLSEGGGSFETSLVLRGGGPAAGGTIELDPFASFIWTNSDVTSPAEGATPSAKFKQFVPGTLPGAPVGGGQGVLVTYDGRGSMDFDGQVVSYAWSGTAAGGWTATGSVYARTYNPAVDTTDTVTLIVTDNDGNASAPFTAQVLLKGTTANPTADDTVPGGSGFRGGQAMIMQLFTAVDTHMSASRDGGGAWTDRTKAAAGVSGNFISVSARVAYEDWTVAAVFGTAAGELVRTTDWCATSALVASLGAVRIEDVWASTYHPGVFFAVTNNGKIYRSADGGVTWALFKDFGDGFPLYALGTPGDNIFVFGGNSSTPDSLIRWSYGATENFWPIAIAGALATALTAAGAGHHVIAAASREFGELAILFDTGVSPRLWYCPDIFKDGTNWTAATGLAVGDGKALAPGFLGPGELVAIVASLTSYYATNGIAFAAKGAAASQINHTFWEVGQWGAYLAMAETHVLKTNDLGATWGIVRNLATLDASARGRKISFVVAPLQPVSTTIYVLGTNRQKLTAGNVWEDKGATPANSLKLRNFNGLLWHNTGVDLDHERSEDGGETWDGVATIAGQEGVVEATRDAGGRMWLATTDTTPAPDQQNTYYSDDIGDTWTASDSNNMPLGASPEGAFMGIAAHPSDQNRIAVAYRNNADNLMKARVTTNRGTAWTTRTISSEAAYAGNGTVGTGGRLFWLASGRLVAIYTTRGVPLHVHVRYSDDDGATWTTALDLAMSGNEAHGYFLTAIRAGSFGPIFFALDRDSGLGTSLIYRGQAGSVWEALDSPVVDTSPILGFAHDLVTDTLYILYTGGAVYKVANASSVAPADWLISCVALPASDAGARYEGIAVLP